MRRLATLVMVVVLVVSMAGMASLAIAADDDGTDAQNQAQPGEALHGALGVTEAEIEGELADRGFGIMIAQAASNESQAEIVADRLVDIDERLTALEERKAQLEAEREAGDITHGQYQAKIAILEAERGNTDRMAAQTEAASKGIPADVLEANGVSAEHIQELRERANELTGPEVAEIAQNIAGPNVGDSLPGMVGDRAAPDDRGQPDDAGPTDEDDEDADDTPANDQADQ